MQIVDFVVISWYTESKPVGTTFSMTSRQNNISLRVFSEAVGLQNFMTQYEYISNVLGQLYEDYSVKSLGFMKYRHPASPGYCRDQYGRLVSCDRVYIATCRFDAYHMVLCLGGRV